MEKIVQELLNCGFIRSSTSPYLSPVLLFKKKDGSCHFYVDYRALNVLTVRDQFPIPTIDELLDELGHGNVFSNMLVITKSIWIGGIYTKLLFAPIMVITSSLLCHLGFPMLHLHFR